MTIAPVDLPASSSAGDRKLIQLWLHGHAGETARAYLSDAILFLEYAEKPLRDVALEDLQNYRDALEKLEFSPATVRRRLNVVKSLLSFGYKTGALRFDVGRALRLPAVRNTLAERILSEADVMRLISRQDGSRNAVLCRTLYAAALRNAEAANLRKRHVHAHGPGGVLSIFGKGARSRVVRVSPATFAEIVRILPADADDRVFDVGERQIRNIVKAAAARAGLPEDVSPHWLRHAHASHALDRGCPIHLVQQTLGHKSVQTTGAYLHARPNDSSALYLPV
jgi:integrase/recombinase XerD